MKSITILLAVFAAVMMFSPDIDCATPGESGSKAPAGPGRRGTDAPAPAASGSRFAQAARAVLGRNRQETASSSAGTPEGPATSGTANSGGNRPAGRFAQAAARVLGRGSRRTQEETTITPYETPAASGSGSARPRKGAEEDPVITPYQTPGASGSGSARPRKGTQETPGAANHPTSPVASGSRPAANQLLVERAADAARGARRQATAPAALPAYERTNPSGKNADLVQASGASTQRRHGKGNPPGYEPGSGPSGPSPPGPSPPGPSGSAAV